MCAHQCWVAWHNIQGYHPEINFWVAALEIPIRREYPELLHVIRRGDRTLVHVAPLMVACDATSLTGVVLVTQRPACVIPCCTDVCIVLDPPASMAAGSAARC